jgi:D-beta-D-heptose 7-phosphate kinase/D-beta-D-heptose 1-phosphate adenosyltransferase
VLVIGDLMIDEYLRGEVHRVSPEAPVPVVDLRSTEHRLGGAANTAHNLARLGAAVTRGRGGRRRRRRPGAGGGARARRHRRPHRGAIASGPTTRKTRVVAGGHQIVRIDAERRTAVDRRGPVRRAGRDDRRRGRQRRRRRAVRLRQGRHHPAAGGAGDRRVPGRGVPVVVDPKQRDFATYAGATVITPNLHELEHAVGHAAHELSEIDAGAATLARIIDGAALLVTRGADGMTLYQDGVRGHHVPAAAREVFDVTGAGDTVVATLTLALAARLALPEAMELASLAAGIAVSRRGTVDRIPRRAGRGHRRREAGVSSRAAAVAARGVAPNRLVTGTPAR